MMGLACLRRERFEWIGLLSRTGKDAKARRDGPASPVTNASPTLSPYPGLEAVKQAQASGVAEKMRGACLVGLARCIPGR